MTKVPNIASPPLRVLELLLALTALAGQVTESLGAELNNVTLEGFTWYVRATEARIERELARPGEFLYIDGLPRPRRADVFAAIRRGEIYMERLQTRDASGSEIRAPQGLIHHWIGDVFIQGATLGQVRDLVEDYDHHQDIYKPEVVRSRLISRNGDDFKIFYRFRKHKIITVTLNTQHDVHYTSVDATHCHSRSTATRIAEVEHADQPDERELPLGHDGGFLWRLNSYWRFEEREGGVYIECESISLTRDIPTGLGWLIRPFITGIPRESLQMTLGSTRSAVLERMAAAPRQ